MAHLRFLLIFAASMVLAVMPASAEQRLALVIGNDSYVEVSPLQKAVNDAETMSQTFAALGFEVIKATDVGRRDMNRTLSEFTARIQPGDVAAVFFAGHGVEINGENFLLPVDIPDASPGQEGFVRSEAISLNAVLDALNSRQARLNIVLLDACRNNPFTPQGSRSLGATRGLARINAPQGTFIMYSADAGEAALDRLSDSDPHQNSVFTRTLAPLMAEPGRDLVDLAREVRRKVRALASTVSHQQTPAYYDAVLGSFQFKPAAQPAVATTPAPSAGTGTGTVAAAPQATPEEDIKSDFTLAQSINAPEAWEAFLTRHADKPSDFYVLLAKAALLKLQTESQQSATAPSGGGSQQAQTGGQTNLAANGSLSQQGATGQLSGAQTGGGQSAVNQDWGNQTGQQGFQGQQGGQGAGSTRTEYGQQYAALEPAELQDFGVQPTADLYTGAMHAPTPVSIPGGRTVTTADLADMQALGQRFLVLDVLGGNQRLPNAQWVVGASEAGSYNDQIQSDFGAYLQQATGGDYGVGMVLYCQGIQCWMSYNAALRAINLGYTNVMWYRGGVEAWQAAGGYLVPW